VLAPGQKVSVWLEKTSSAPALATDRAPKPVAGAAQAAILTSTR
jgi:hypothetical protein